MSEQRYLILKRGLYYRPNSQGYTPVKEEAGRYSLEEVAERFPNLDSPQQDGMSFVAEADAPEYSPSCPWDVKLRRRAEKAEQDRDRLKGALQEIAKPVRDNRTCLPSEFWRDKFFWAQDRARKEVG